MFKVNDTVLYGVDGVCCISEIVQKKFGKETLEYYVLKPVATASSTIFIPVDNEVLTERMRRILSPDEIYEIIHSVPDENLAWVENDMERQRGFNDILRSGDRTKIIQLIKTLHGKKQDLLALKRKLRAADEKLLKEAESILYEEFAYVLNINQDEMLPFIIDEINVEARRA